MFKDQLQGFINFIREQGFIKLAVAFLLGGAVSKLVTSLVTDIINPVLSIVLGSTESLKDLYWTVGDVKITYGNFLNNFVDFMTIAIVIYFALNLIKIDRLDRKKEAKEAAKAEVKKEEAKNEAAKSDKKESAKSESKEESKKSAR